MYQGSSGALTSLHIIYRKISWRASCLIEEFQLSARLLQEQFLTRYELQNNVSFVAALAALLLGNYFQALYAVHLLDYVVLDIKDTSW